MQAKRALVLVAVIIAAVAAYWYYSPYVAMHALQRAAQQRDAEAFNARVDYARLRASVKEQFAAALTEKMTNSGGFEALGAALGLALVNPMIDALVSPEAVMQAMQRGEFGLRSPQESPEPSQESTSGAEWTFERPSTDRIIAYRGDAGSDTSEAVGFVFERSGFADWKLTGLRIPRP